MAANPLLTLMIVLALGGLFGQIPFGPIRFGAAGALFMGLVIGALDPRFGEGLGLVKSLGVVLFCYTVGLVAGTTFRSDLRRQWGAKARCQEGKGENSHLAHHDGLRGADMTRGRRIRPRAAAEPGRPPGAPRSSRTSVADEAAARAKPACSASDARRSPQ